MDLMSVAEKFLHFFTPRYTNNHRPAALKFSAISFYIGLFLVFQIGLTLTAKFNPQILGYATNITVSDLLRLTNEKRLQNAVSAVEINDKLSLAAQKKAEDMFANQYWAHTSPNGRDPWSFVLDSGYTYLYAGENLARDFADSKGVVEAWVNSPSHRENLLNNRYKDVGFAVVNGKYGSYETTLVVQMFGTKTGSPPTVEAPAVAETSAGKPSLQSTPSGMVLKTEIETPKPKVDIFAVTKAVSMVLTVMLLVVLTVDAVLIYRRQTVRVSGHNLAHIMLLLVLLAVLNLIGKGIIL